jgi:hypothetical protein
MKIERDTEYAALLLQIALRPSAINVLPRLFLVSF